MIIKDLQLTNFGKFNHKSMSLEPGLNIIYGENEAGKTTFHTFIRGKGEKLAVRIRTVSMSLGTTHLITKG